MTSPGKATITSHSRFMVQKHQAEEKKKIIKKRTCSREIYLNKLSVTLKSRNGRLHSRNIHALLQI